MNSHSAFESVLADTGCPGDGDCLPITRWLQDVLDQANRDRLATAVRQLSNSELATESCELAIQRGGAAISHKVCITPLIEEQARIFAAVWTFHDVSGEHKPCALNPHR